MAFGSALSLSVALLAAATAATPLNSLVKRGAFSLQQVEVKSSRPFIAPEVVQRTYNKFGAPVPPAILEAAEAQREEFNTQTGAFAPGTGSAVVYPVKGDVEYLVNVTVGNHELALDLDTGSSDLWVFSVNQPSQQREGRPVTRVYDPSGGKAVKIAGHTWQIRYGDQSGANGTVYKDAVTVGGITVRNQAVEAASTVSRTFVSDIHNDGLLGFAFSKLNTVRPTPQKTWLENAIPLLKEPVFTCNLKRRAVGTYDFGFIDKSKYKGEITYVDVNTSRGFWQFSPTAFTIGTGTSTPVKMNAIADTGTSLWYMPQAVTDAYWSKVPGAGYNLARAGYTFPCNAELPDMSITVNGRLLTVAGINMNYQRTGMNTCFGGLQRDTGMPFSIFGDVFLKSLFAVFEMKPGRNPRIGFAQQA